MPIIEPVKGIWPRLGPKVWIAPSAVVVGDVILEDEVSVWFNAVVRGDVNRIFVGAQTNIQDGVVIHATYEKADTWIGPRVTIGHSCIIHGCHISEGCLIGMGSIVMDHVQIGPWCLVGAGSLLPPGKQYPEKHLILGRPAQAVRPLSPEELASLTESVNQYLIYKSWFEHPQSSARNSIG